MTIKLGNEVTEQNNQNDVIVTTPNNNVTTDVRKNGFLTE